MSRSEEGPDGRQGVLVPEEAQAVAVGTRWGVAYRDKSPNAMTAVEPFMRGWMDPRHDRRPAVFSVSDEGNINRVGQPGEHAADDLDPMHPSWRVAIEPHVYPLVDVLTHDLGVITYDSCEGHASQHEPSARVGILPRTLPEGELIAGVVNQAVADQPSGTQGTWATFVSVLTCSETGRGFLTIELRLSSSTFTDRPEFFRTRGRAVNRLASDLRKRWSVIPAAQGR